jgi:hypothetical protein
MSPLAPESQSVEFEIGRYLCPVTQTLAPLKATQPWTALEWPLPVPCCAACGQAHLISFEDLRHPPLFGYE